MCGYSPVIGLGYNKSRAEEAANFFLEIILIMKIIASFSKGGYAKALRLFLHVLAKSPEHQYNQSNR